MKKSFMLMAAIVLFTTYSCNLFNKEKTEEVVETEDVAVVALTKIIDAEDGTFQISFPGTPEFTSEPVETDAGLVQNNMYIYEHNVSLAYMLAYTDYPAEHIDGFDPYELLDNAMNGFVGEVGLAVDKNEKVKIKNFPGLEFIASGDGYWAHMTDYLVDNRLYQVGILSTSGKVNTADAKAFFDSLILK
jgi:hypothetical protein